MLATVYRRYHAALREPGFIVSTCIGVLAVVAALYFNFWAITQATARAGLGVADIILSNIPVFDVDGIFVYGTFFVAVVGVLLFLPHPKRIPFGLKTAALFIVIRSLFTLMTHLGPPEAQYVTQFGETIAHSFFGADQFFSAHTGLPFLGVVALWDIDRRVALFCLGASLFFAAVVLLGHIHYTIDVASAFFITYGIVHIARWLFVRDWALFSQKE